MVREVGGLRFYVYETALKGFAVANLPAGAVETLRRHPRVLVVEEDALIRPLDIAQDVSAPADTGLYGLDRIDQRSRTLDDSYTYFADGTGVHIYIVDSGVRGGHQEFAGRIGNGAAFIKWSWNPNPYIDQLGHGTAVAGASAGSTVGVAKGATIHSVRINDGNNHAYASDIIAGLDWVAGNRILPAVANLSYEATSQAIATAVSGVINAGVSFTAAAGNGTVDACNAVTQTPGVITVGATTVSDTRASYSNFGSCLDVFAPGGAIGGIQNGHGLVKLASNSSDASYTHSWGTSFAAPYAAGVAALILEQNGTLSPAGVAGLITSHATTNMVIDPGPGSPNRLLYSRIAVTAPPPPPPILPTITGPTWVRPGSNCLWHVGSGDAVLPVTYAWFVDTVTQSELSGSLRHYASSADFELQAALTDANTVVWWSNPYLVTVSPEAPECLDQ